MLSSERKVVDWYKLDESNNGEVQKIASGLKVKVLTRDPAVSYTHLDVYKRQVFICVVCFN